MEKNKKIAFVYFSTNKTQNTFKLLQKMKEVRDIDLIEVSQAKDEDLAKYDIVGFASGIYAWKFSKKIINFIASSTLNNLNVVIVSTSGGKATKPHNKIKEIIKAKQWNLLSEFNTIAVDKFGPFGWIGGLNKNRPNEQEIQQSKDWIKSL